jgi:hypothetical protein
MFRDESRTNVLFSFIHHIQQVKFVGDVTVGVGCKSTQSPRHIHCPIAITSIIVILEFHALEELLPGPDGGG